jgi:hypothetical protein
MEDLPGGRYFGLDGSVSVDPSALVCHLRWTTKLCAWRSGLLVGVDQMQYSSFCFFYTALVFNSKETADNLKKSGAFVPGIRPGEQTARYIDKILMRLTLAGAVYITAVCLLPEFMQAQWKVSFYFGGTSLLIIVVVTMDFMAQVQNYVMSQQYESLLRKANFKGGLPTR